MIQSFHTYVPVRLCIAATASFIMGAIVGVQAATTVTVGQHGLVFKKSAVTLAKGDRIVFTNEDDVIHNIHIFGAGDYDKDLGLQKPGAALSYTFDKAGPYTVRCNIHPSVRMAVTVK
jgi:plastocyanin